MSATTLRIVIIGLSITSSWGNGHATTYRGLVRELVRRGHDVLFLERDVEWYRDNRDMPNPPFGRTELYSDTEELIDRFATDVREADLVIVGSYVHDGVAVGAWVTREARGATAFYDIDTPVTLARLARGDHEYITPALVGRYDLYLSFTGGPTLRRIERELGSPMARALYCSVDPELYYPEALPARWELGYMGTYSDDRQPTVDALLVAPARALPERRFIVAGPMYPETITWPGNVERVVHLAPREHRDFYNSQRWTLNVTRADMIAAGWSPSVRLFEAAACATPIVSDRWSGIETLFEPGREIVLADGPADVIRALTAMPEEERRAMGERARARVLAEHTAAHR
ncbi:MAG TPA: glycosyltransferase, partial [Gemmatimonadaceae bacterium]|nr:glycosyltransferase [Gemmatimonadaceae bacterium]